MCISIHVHEGITRINFSQASVHEITSMNTIQPKHELQDSDVYPV